jgi:hypothetical protein
MPALEAHFRNKAGAPPEKLRAAVQQGAVANGDTSQVDAWAKKSGEAVPKPSSSIEFVEVAA